MKKVITFCLILCFGALLCSCNSNDAIINQFEQAINEGDYDEAAELLYQLDEDRLTEEQQLRLAEIATGGATKSLMGTYLKYLHEGGSAVNELMSDIDEDLELLYDEDDLLDFEE